MNLCFCTYQGWPSVGFGGRPVFLAFVFSAWVVLILHQVLQQRESADLGPEMLLSLLSFHMPFSTNYRDLTHRIFAGALSH